ncbi:hypothetical protein EHF33_07340 [Deinococcus psychrotolerans]|uniref:Uncharacterized protein n=1 Tax=Deinococcus psychrotolerans TaxID=2489213 RepID=A0A3G8YLT0_9DEIO|nr:hypothetical protein [Deinococcus psychrotolerans]AZI42581.1 hypothetical protein EHF33_07340 [Deinococcus psychrotolerans]
MGEGKPSSIPSKEAQAEKGVERNTIPESASQEVWNKVEDGGVNVKTETVPTSPAPEPEAGSIPEKSVTYGSLKDGMTPSGATTDPNGDAGKPKLGEN